MFKGPGVENLTIMFLEMWNAFEEKEGGYRDFVPAEYEEKGGEGDGYILSFSDSPLDDENASENVYAVSGHRQQPAKRAVPCGKARR